MSITLTPVRYLTNNDPRHYIIDNRPIEDVSSNIEILKTAIEALDINFVNYTAQGTWGAMAINIPLNNDRNKAFGYRIKIWALKDKAETTTQDSVLQVITILGSNDVAGNVVIHNSNTSVNLQFGDPVTISLTPGFDHIAVSFSGYTGVNGFVQIKAERFGF